MPTPDNSADSNGGDIAGRHGGLYAASSKPPLTDVEENGAESNGTILSARRMPRSESGSRSSRRRVDSGRPHGLSRVAKGAAAFGILLVSLMALRFVICFGTVGLYRASRQNISPGTTPRGLADERALLLSGDPTDRRGPGEACSGLFETGGHYSAPLRPGSSADDGGVRLHMGGASPARRPWQEVLFRDRITQLALTAVAFSVVGLTFYGLAMATESSSFFEYATYTCFVLALAALLGQLYGVWVERQTPQYQPLRQEVRL